MDPSFINYPSMSDPSPKRLEIGQPAQLEALTSPVRLEMLELFGLFGPCSVTDVARHMERAPDSLYYHVRKLVEVGLLVRSGDRAGTHRSEALYRLPADELEIPREADSADVRRTRRRTIDAFLRLAGRELDAALMDEDAEDEGAGRVLYGRRLRAKISTSALAEVNRHIAAIEDVFAQAKERGEAEGTTVAVTIVMTPTTKRREG